MHFARAFIPYKEAKANFFLRLLELVQLEKTKNKLHFFFFLNQQDKTIYATLSTSLKKIKKKKTKMKDISSNNIRFIV